MCLESAAKGASEISGNSNRVNRVGKYSCKNLKKIKRIKRSKLDQKEKSANCYFSGLAGVQSDTFIHVK